MTFTVLVLMLFTTVRADLTNYVGYAGAYGYGGKYADYVNDDLNEIDFSVGSVYPTNGDYDDYRYVRVRCQRSNQETIATYEDSLVIEEGTTKTFHLRFSSYQQYVYWSLKGNTPGLSANVVFTTR